MRVVAHQPEHRAIRLWIDTEDGSGRPAEQARIRVVDEAGTELGRWPSQDSVPVDPSRFPTLSVWHVSGLEPGRGYAVEDDRGRSLAAFRTLPERLPLTVAVGSCYSVDDDGTTVDGTTPSPPSRWATPLRWVRRVVTSTLAVVPHPGGPDDGPGSVSPRYEALSRELERAGRPIDVAILLGDQVYVDQPPWRYVVPRGAEAAWRLVADRYRATWARLGPLLSSGANICVSEDHEYWNNYPSVPPWLWFWSWPTDRLEPLRDAAIAHRSAFQQTEAVRTFRAGTDAAVSFFVADTRCRRSAVAVADEGFMRPEPFARLVAWIGALDGPGVVVLGQPLLTSPGSSSNTTLASYPEQHGALCDAVARAAHDVVVVCGDVHFGRLSVVPLAGGRKLVEVVSSPLALLAAAGNVATEPVVPPRLAASGAASSWFLDDARPDGTGEDHVTILTFAPADGGGVSLHVTPYFTRYADAAGLPLVAASWEPLPLS